MCVSMCVRVCVGVGDVGVWVCQCVLLHCVQAAAEYPLCGSSPLALLSSHALHRFEYSLNGFSVFVNDEGTRTFLSLDVVSGNKEVHKVPTDTHIQHYVLRVIAG